MFYVRIDNDLLQPRAPQQPSFRKSVPDFGFMLTKDDNNYLNDMTAHQRSRLILQLGLFEWGGPLALTPLDKTDNLLRNLRHLDSLGRPVLSCFRL